MSEPPNPGEPDPARSALIAPDKFKGTMSAAEVVAALVDGFEREGWATDPCPLADGGEGTGEAMLTARGGEWIEARAHDPIGRPIEARYALLADGVAVVEVAAATGLALLAPDELDPLGADSTGTGELILAAAARSDVVLVALGGSATTDGGVGALRAIEEGGGIGEAKLVCLCDVSTTWEDAARTFGPQKGASTEQIAELEQRMGRLAEALAKDPRGVAMCGAAGGVAGGLWAEHKAELRAGAAFVLDAVSFNGRAAGADLVVTGEGRLDETTAHGKLVAEVARRCGCSESRCMPWLARTRCPSICARRSGSSPCTRPRTPINWRAWPSRSDRVGRPRPSIGPRSWIQSSST